MKKTLTILVCALVLVMLFAFSASAAVYSGKCGDSATYSLNTSTGTLTISGTGAIADYNETSTPWYSYRSSVKSVIIESGITTIGKYSLSSLTNLTSVTLANTVKTLRQNAFRGDTALKEINLPKSVTSYAYGTFANCTALAAINVAKDNPTFASDENGIMYNKSMTKLVRFPAGSAITDFTVPASVTEISTDAFNWCKKLTKVTFHKDVATIPGQAFVITRALECIEVAADSPYFVTDEKGVLYNADKTTLIKYPSALADTTYTIPDTVTALDYGAFGWNNQLTSMSVPDTVQTLGNYAFAQSYNLASITLGDGITSIGSYVFNECESLKTIALPETVTAIGSYAFRNCRGLESVNIPNGVATINSNTFYGCESLKSLTLPETVTAIGSYAFYNCYALESVNIPSGVETINSYTFYNCESLKSIALPETVTAIGSYAFYNCWLLENVNIPSGVTKINNQTFNNCRKLKSITLPEGIETIGSAAFYFCQLLESINIPSTVTTIGASAFIGCSGNKAFTVADGNTAFTTDDNGVLFNKDFTELVAYPLGNEATAYTVPNTVQKIHEHSFGYNYTLTEVNVPATVETIGNGAFTTMRGLTSINVDDDNPIFVDVDGVLFSNDMTVLMQYPAGILETTYIIPETVTEIGYKAFQGSEGLVSITIPDNVTKIGNLVFEYCYALKTVTIGKGITTIPERTFGDCRALETVIVPETVTSIGNNAFLDCDKLTLHGSFYGKIFDYAISNNIPFDRHNGEWTTHTPLTTSAFGEYYRICTFCGEEETKAIKKSEITVGSKTIRTTTGSFTAGVSSEIIDDDIYTTVSALANCIRFSTIWNSASKTITIMDTDTTVVMTINENTAIVNGEKISVNTPARIINNYTCLPVKFIIEAFGYESAWDEEAQIFTINPISVTDLDGDGELNVKDVLFSFKALLNGEAVENADYNGDGKFGLIDILRIMKAITA